ncbi:hypothetical protein GIB67_022795 [Kingdonia uniflora]|uniref:Pentatricopeptide repeat-containing protein n=1 Tax=Kingdonia uniflora TaxID=39325 RepID=A0A7J7P7J7_9MAGN|nr:hypothetical protein GIB67_022795 [Kingdonia uniflora]
MVRESDVKPDQVTFVALISACSHAGLVEEGLTYFKEMDKEYRITPLDENHKSVVDLLALLRLGNFGHTRISRQGNFGQSHHSQRTGLSL